MSIGLIALLDEVAAITKVAAGSLDDVAALAAKAAAKAAGVVIDDAAVTPRYVLGFAASRELPIVWRIARGSLRNKLLLLLPATLALSYFLPWMITPLLMLGGAYLCYEGTEKVLEAIIPQRIHAHEGRLNSLSSSTRALEDKRVAGAIRTDLILSAEIMAITLAVVSDQTIVVQAFVLASVGIGITAAVYGLVALIVKADDIGVALATGRRVSFAGSAIRAFGRALVRHMPGFLTLLSAIGTAAMIWVGGSIIVHGLETLQVFFAAEATARGLASPASFLKQSAVAFTRLAVGLVIGTLSILLVDLIILPGRKLLMYLVRKCRGTPSPVR